MNYKTYKLSLREIIQIAGISAGLLISCSILFYDSGWPCILYIPLMIFVCKRQKKNGIERRKQQLAEEFCDALRVVKTSLWAGMSMENAWMEAQREMEILHGQRCAMTLELQEMNRGIHLNRPIESMLEEFANRSGVEDIQQFAEVFSYAKRTGGNLAEIIAITTRHLREKQEVEKEISVMVAAKNMEQKVMNVIPLGILLFLRVSSDGYLDALYHNPTGIGIMSICLLCYGGAIVLSQRIMNIRV